MLIMFLFGVIFATIGYMTICKWERKINQINNLKQYNSEFGNCLALGWCGFMIFVFGCVLTILPIILLIII